VNEKKIFFSKNIFLFQGASGVTESAVFKKLIAPFKNDLPATNLDGFRRVCADKKYAFIGNSPFITELENNFPCQLVRLPGTSYRDPWAIIISKNSPYKGLINWR
jgi:hypothetical protein